MKYLLEAKIFRCPADLSVCLFSLPYHKWNVGGIDILDNLLLCYCSTEIVQGFQIPFFACLASGHDIHVEEGAQGGQKNMHSPASLSEHRSDLQVLLFHSSPLKPSREHPYRREEAWHQGGIGSALCCFVYARMKMNLATVLGTADWLTAISSLPCYFLRLQLFPFWRLSW